MRTYLAVPIYIYIKTSLKSTHQYQLTKVSIVSEADRLLKHFILKRSASSRPVNIVNIKHSNCAYPSANANATDMRQRPGVMLDNNERRRVTKCLVSLAIRYCHTNLGIQGVSQNPKFLHYSPFAQILQEPKTNYLTFPSAWGKSKFSRIGGDSKVAFSQVAW